MSQLEPKRLLEDSSISDELRLGLQELHARAPGPAQLARIAAGLSATGVAVDTGAVQGATESAVNGASAAKTSATAGKYAVWKLALIALVPAGVGLTFALWPADNVQTRSRSLPESSIAEPTLAPTLGEGRTNTAPPAAAARGAVGATAGAATDRLPVPLPEQAPNEPSLPIAAENHPASAPVANTDSHGSAEAHRVPLGKAAPHTTGAAPPTTSSTEGKRSGSAAPVSTIPGRTEVELLQTASTVLGSNPSEALQLCEEHQRNYPGGAMTQEREMIAITALVRLGRQEDAYARAERFRRNYPKSAYLRQIDKVSPPR